MLERLNDYKIRKAIAKALTEQCDIDKQMVVAGDIHTISTIPTMEGFDVVFTTNGKDGEKFTTSVKNVGIFSETYVGEIELAEPKYNHEVYFIYNNMFGDVCVASRRTTNTTQTYDEWLMSLYESGVLDNMLDGANWTSSFSNLGHPIFRSHKAAKEYTINLNLRDAFKSMMDRIDEACKPKPVEVWGIKPLSKQPVLLGMDDNTGPTKTGFHQLCHRLKDVGVGITFSQDFRKREYPFYNGRPVFETKEAAQKCIDVEYGRCKPRDEKLTVKFKCDLLKPFQIWGFDEAFAVTMIGYGCGETFEEALQEFWDKNVMWDGTGRPKNHCNNGEWTYMGRPVFKTEEAAIKYARSKAGTKQFVKSLTADQVTIRDLPYYKDLVGLLGERRASEQLNKVLDTPECFDSILAQTIGDAFTWHLTPQGEEYWALIEYDLWAKHNANQDNSCKPQ